MIYVAIPNCRVVINDKAGKAVTSSKISDLLTVSQSGGATA